MDGRYTIDWDSPDLQEKVKGTIEFLTKGCSCKCGCRTLVCGCRKKSQHCGPGCECHGCTNLAVHATYDDQSDASLTESDLESHTSADGSSTESSDNDLEIEVVTDIDHDWI